MGSSKGKHKIEAFWDIVRKPKPNCKHCHGTGKAGRATYDKVEYAIACQCITRGRVRHFYKKAEFERLLNAVLYPHVEPPTGKLIRPPGGRKV